MLLLLCRPGFRNLSRRKVWLDTEVYVRVRRLGLRAVERLLRVVLDELTRVRLAVR